MLNTSTLVDAEELVLVLPAQTRYESGGTSTSTERRMRYSPAIDDPDGVNIAEARAEWQIPALIGRALEPANNGAVRLAVARRRARRDGRARCRSTPASKGSPPKGSGCSGAARAWGRTGSPTCPTAARGSRRCAIPTPALPAGKFMLATRRGKQFNSITYGQKDPITGVASAATSCSSTPTISQALGIERRRARRRALRRWATWKRRRASARAGASTLQAFWPEANVLLARVVRSGVGRARLQRRRLGRARRYRFSNFSCCVVTARCTAGRCSSAFADARIFGPTVKPMLSPHR